MELPEGFVEVYDFYYVPFWQQSWFIALAVIVFILLIGALGYIVYRWYRARKTIVAQELPHEWAYNQLEVIKPQGEVALRELPNYYLSLTYILKTYIEKRYGWQVSHKTDQELVIFLEGSDLSSSHKELFPLLLSRAQEIKFAPEAVTKHALHDWHEIHEFISQAKEQVPPLSHEESK